MQFILKNIEDTSNLAMILVACLQKMDQFPAILLQGDLGSGKTTMTRMLVRLLPVVDLSLEFGRIHIVIVSICE